jgi:aspartate-semialdehyde dehydrogenase
VFDSIAVVGATGAVGTIICHLLEARKLPFKRIKFLASKRSAGKTLTFAGKTYPVNELKPGAFTDVTLAICSTPDDVARDFVPYAVAEGCTVIDESGYWRMDPKVPLVIPEVNACDIWKHQGIISSPNCSTTQMVVALKPLHDYGKVRRVVVSTYQATSGAGLAGCRDLENGTRAFLNEKAFRRSAR